MASLGTRGVTPKDIIVTAATTGQSFDGVLTIDHADFHPLTFDRSAICPSWDLLHVTVGESCCLAIASYTSSRLIERYER